MIHRPNRALYFVTDSVTGKIESVLQETSNSYLVSQSKNTDKGIDCNNWFDEKRFKQRFVEIKDLERNFDNGGF